MLREMMAGPGETCAARCVQFQREGMAPVDNPPWRCEGCREPKLSSFGRSAMHLDQEPYSFLTVAADRMRLPDGGGPRRGAGRRFRRLLLASVRSPPAPSLRLRRRRLRRLGSGKHKKIVRNSCTATATRVPAHEEPGEVKFRIYVLGDQLAVATSDGLTESVRDKREIAVADKEPRAVGHGSRRYFDWRKKRGRVRRGKEKRFS